LAKTSGSFMTPDEQRLTESLSPSPRIALLPWGDLIEDFLDEIGISLEDFCTKMTGGWLFGYVDALRLRGIRTTIFCFSDRVQGTIHKVHQPTSAEFVVIRTSAAHRKLRRRTKDPYALTAEAMFGSGKGLSGPMWRIAHRLAPYLATPVFALAREIRRARCSTILCQEYESPRFDASVLAGALLGIPVFATFQGGSWHRSGVERILRPMALRRCAGLVIGSSDEIARVRQRYGVPPEKISQIFNPLDLSEWQLGSRDDARRKLGIPAASRVAVWHGRIDVRTKGLDILLAAWKTICAQCPDREMLLLLVGAGSGSNTLEDEIRRTAVPHIRWVRDYILDRQEIRRYLSTADVYVFPSRREGFPVAPLEAMACGLPVVATSAPGVADIFSQGEESGGLVVPVDDVPALAKNLSLLLNDDKRARALGVCSRKRIEQAFSLQTVGSQLERFIAERSDQNKSS
jgi:glycosyltransferase involved in cell wall biosynthesis